MNPEVIFWYTFHIVSTILGIFIAFMVLKYLDKKPLGMQTIFDEIIKDFIYLNMLDWLTFIVAVAASYFPPLNHYTINTILICKITMSSAVTYQLSILMLIRYFHVFYPNQMNNAPFARNLARLFLVYTSLTSSLVVDVKNTIAYHMIIDGNRNHTLSKKENTDGIQFPLPIAIGISTCIVIFIFTQYKIERFNQSVDAQQQQPQLVQHQQEREENQDQNVSEENSKTTYRIVLVVMIALAVSCMLFMVIIHRTPPEHLYIKMLRLVSIRLLILYNIIPIILIIRSENISSFFKSQITIILKSCRNCKNNQIEPIVELNVL